VASTGIAGAGDGGEEEDEDDDDEQAARETKAAAAAQITYRFMTPSLLARRIFPQV
jgi:hypothetical protein